MAAAEAEAEAEADEPSSVTKSTLKPPYSLLLLLRKWPAALSDRLASLAIRAVGDTSNKSTPYGKYGFIPSRSGGVS